MIKKNLNSLSESKEFAKQFASEISTKHSDIKHSSSQALVIALSGDLGSGKTTFVQNFLRAFGVKQKITSPTFVLLKRYELRDKSYERAFHVDAYRIKNPKELLSLGFKEILDNPQNIVLIEWAENIKNILPSARGGSSLGGKNIYWLKFEHGKKENERIINF